MERKHKKKKKNKKRRTPSGWSRRGGQKKKKQNRWKSTTRGKYQKELLQRHNRGQKRKKDLGNLGREKEWHDDVLRLWGRRKNTGGEHRNEGGERKQSYHDITPQTSLNGPGKGGSQESIPPNTRDGPSLSEKSKRPFADRSQVRQEGKKNEKGGTKKWDQSPGYRPGVPKHGGGEREP